MKKYLTLLILPILLTACYNSTPPQRNSAAAANDARHATPEKVPSMPEPSGVSPTNQAR